MTATSPTMVVRKPPPGLSSNDTPEQLEILEEGGSVEEWSILELTTLLFEGEEYLDGSTTRTRAMKEGGCTSVHHAVQLLRQQDSVPEEWRQFYLVFPGTLLQDEARHPFIPCLLWCGGTWVLSYDYAGVGSGGWSENIRVVRVYGYFTSHKVLCMTTKRRMFKQSLHCICKSIVNLVAIFKDKGRSAFVIFVDLLSLLATFFIIGEIVSPE